MYPRLRKDASNIPTVKKRRCSTVVKWKENNYHAGGIELRYLDTRSSTANKLATSNVMVKVMMNEQSHVEFIYKYLITDQLMTLHYSSCTMHITVPSKQTSCPAS